jgi:hypothetical protein
MLYCGESEPFPRRHGDCWTDLSGRSNTRERQGFCKERCSTQDGRITGSFSRHPIPFLKATAGATASHEIAFDPVWIVLAPVFARYPRALAPVPPRRHSSASFPSFPPQVLSIRCRMDRTSALRALPSLPFSCQRAPAGGPWVNVKSSSVVGERGCSKIPSVRITPPHDSVCIRLGGSIVYWPIRPMPLSLPHKDLLDLDHRKKRSTSSSVRDS